MTDRLSARVNDPAIVRREYASEDRFLARRLANQAELRGPLAEDVAIAAVAEGSPRRVLDVGCGTGDFSERIPREVGAELTALDLSPRMAALARERGLRTAVADIEALPIADAMFDCVVANRVLYHLPDLDRGLTEISRVLRPGGRLLAIAYGRDHLAELWHHVGESPQNSLLFCAENGADLLRPHFDHVERRDVVGTARFPSRESILRLLGSYGEFADPDVEWRLAGVHTPFDATYRHCMFVAQSITIETSSPRW